MLEYLLEIGCEELPAAYVSKSAAFMKSEIKAKLDNVNLPFGNIETGGTPRRLYLFISQLAEKQTDKSEIIMGPPAAIAFDNEGKISPVGIKFAESKGLDLTTLKKVVTTRGEYLQGEKKNRRSRNLHNSPDDYSGTY